MYCDILYLVGVCPSRCHVDYFMFSVYISTSLFGRKVFVFWITEVMCVCLLYCIRLVSVILHIPDHANTHTHTYLYIYIHTVYTASDWAHGKLHCNAEE